jgi:hypothetical protein
MLIRDLFEHSLLKSLQRWTKKKEFSFFERKFAIVPILKFTKMNGKRMYLSIKFGAF